MDKKTLKEIISEEIRLGLKLGTDTWRICPNEVADKIMPQIKKLIKQQLLKMHKSPDNYKSLEKWTKCEHLKENTLTDDCIHCDMDWAIGRMQLLERYIESLKKIIEDLE